MLNTAQLVQDVIDGVEDPLKAYAVLLTHKKEAIEALQEIEGAVLKQIKGKEAVNYKHNGRAYRFENIDDTRFYVVEKN